ncbi:tripartite motif-containing protein 2 [Biomphalaria glabrata]|nr:tripartite motif-containing protein 2 [Biomphalaria glabrata]
MASKFESKSTGVLESYFQPLGYNETQERRLLRNKDEDFEKWRKCLKCHNPLEKPRALPCLHTICLHCLKIHYRTIKLQVAAHERETPNRYNFFSWGCLFPCPICNYPCYMLADSVIILPINKRLLKLTFKERLHRFIGLKYSTQQAGIEKTLLKTPINVLVHREISKYFTAPSSKQLVSLPTDSTISATTTSLVTSGKQDLNKNENSTERSPNVSQQDQRESSQSHVTFSLSHSASDIYESTSEDSADKVADMTALLQTHWNQVIQEFTGNFEAIETEDDCPLPGEQEPELLLEYDLRYGDENLEVRHPNAIAVNPHTGHLVVVDTTWNKAVLYKMHSKPYGYKKFEHPIVDVCFYPPSKDHEERFCAMGRRADIKGIMVYTALFNKNPLDFQCMYQKNLRDVSGILVIEPEVLFLALPYANSVIRSINEHQFIDLATRSQHGLYYPTHIVHTQVGEVVVADTGNHRIAVFYGPQYMAFDFYGELGSDFGKFFYPLGLATDKQRHLYVCDSNNYRVQVFDSSFRFQSCPIRRTFLMSPSVSQDVKPVDCAVNNKQKLLVLFRGRGFISLQMYNYFEPLLKHTVENEVQSSLPEQRFCWNCFLCCGCSCDRGRPDRTTYEVIN